MTRSAREADSNGQSRSVRDRRDAGTQAERIIEALRRVQAQTGRLPLPPRRTATEEDNR